MTLTIREGHFYRTRDGRKVGPMIVWVRMVPTIIEGAYGRLHIAKQAGSEPRLLVNLLNINGRGVLDVSHGWSIAELKDAIRVLTACRDALEGGAE